MSASIERGFRIIDELLLGKSPTSFLPFRPPIWVSSKAFLPKAPFTTSSDVSVKFK